MNLRFVRYRPNRSIFLYSFIYNEFQKKFPLAYYYGKHWTLLRIYPKLNTLTRLWRHKLVNPIFFSDIYRKNKWSCFSVLNIKFQYSVHILANNDKITQAL